MDGSCTDLLAFLAAALDSPPGSEFCRILTKCSNCKGLRFDSDLMPRPFRVSDLSVELLQWADHSELNSTVLNSLPRVVQLMQAHLTSAINEIAYLPWTQKNLGALLHTLKPPSINLIAAQGAQGAPNVLLVDLWQRANLISSEFAASLVAAPENYSGETLIAGCCAVTLRPGALPAAEWFSKGTRHVPHQGGSAVSIQPQQAYELSRCPLRAQHMLSDSNATSILMPAPILDDTLAAHGVVWGSTPSAQQ